METEKQSKVTEYVKKKQECCGCGLCYEKCPKKAIQMTEDEYGFLYPVIDREKCIECGICKKICAFQKEDLNTVKACYAAVNCDKQWLKKSASGGIFSAIAESFLKNGGIVCGAQMTFSEGRAQVKHVAIDNIRDLERLQGSKYVQSDIKELFESTLEQLKQGKKVLFSGTPCQVTALNRFVGMKYAENLYTLDIICHGVPNIQFFNDYIETNFTRKSIFLQKFTFRDKKYGWGVKGSFNGVNAQKEEITEKMDSETSSYYRYFLKGEIYRDSCYYCPFAQENRAGNLTLGDYWGVERFDPELLEKNGGPFQEQEGVSCLMVNNAKGETLLKEDGQGILKREILMENVKVINTQLKKPAVHTELRNKILKTYVQKGYGEVEQIFTRQRLVEKAKKMVKDIIKKVLPDSVVEKIKKSK